MPMENDPVVADVAEYVYPEDPEAVEKELLAAAWQPCDAPHPRMKAVRCLRARGHDGQHYCGGSCMGIVWDDPSEVESGDEDSQVVPDGGGTQEELSLPTGGKDQGRR